MMHCLKIAFVPARHRPEGLKKNAHWIYLRLRVIAIIWAHVRRRGNPLALCAATVANRDI
jgi:hypothetical protein